MSCVEWTDLVLKILTLVAVVWYAFLTLRIARASKAQVEAIQRPFLTLTGVPDTSDDAILEGMIHELLPAEIRLQNIGSGAAINGWFAFMDVEKGKQILRERIKDLAPQEPFKSQYPPHALPKKAKMIATYQSLSGT